MKELIEAYDEYIKLLGESEGCLLPIAMVHGFRLPADLVRRGKEMRAKIARLKQIADIH